MRAHPSLHLPWTWRSSRSLRPPSCQSLWNQCDRAKWLPADIGVWKQKWLRRQRQRSKFLGPRERRLNPSELLRMGIPDLFRGRHTQSEPRSAFYGVHHTIMPWSYCFGFINYLNCLIGHGFAIRCRVREPRVLTRIIGNTVLQIGRCMIYCALSTWGMGNGERLSTV